MKIPLKSDWEQRVTGKAKVYPLGAKDRDLVDDTFNELHRAGKMSWTNESTPFSYPVFCVWRNVDGKRKGRVVVDIRGLNAITQPDAYPLPLQSDMLQLVTKCSYITVIDCSSFFYQWRVHPPDRHKLTVVSQHIGVFTQCCLLLSWSHHPLRSMIHTIERDQITLTQCSLRVILLRIASLEQWSIALTRRFKVRSGKAQPCRQPARKRKFVSTN